MSNASIRPLLLESGWGRAGGAGREGGGSVPVEERQLDLAGISTAVLEGGSGPPVVLLHGPGAYGAAWFPVLADLVTGHRVIAPDLPGHGASQSTMDAVEPDRVLDWLGELIERTCTAPPVLVGQLLGGAIAARFASRHSDRISRLVLVVPMGLAPFAPEPAFGAALAGYATAPTEDTHDELWKHCVYDLDALRHRLADGWFAMRRYNLDRAGDPAASLAQRTMLAEFTSPIPPEALARIAVPTSLVWGRHDSIVPVTVGAAAAERYGWPLRVLDGTGNEPALESPQALLWAAFGVPGRTLERMRHSFNGPVRGPGDDGFAAATAPWNGMVEKRPAAVVSVSGPADVVEAVNFARTHRLPLSVRGGGHHIAGGALVDGGLTVDLSGLRAVTVDPAARTVTVQAGCRLADLDRATQEHGLATPLGFISIVGLSGLTLGGGLGYLTRRFGWTVDNLLSVEIVTADGRIRRASRGHEADLFWAVRGAGAGLGVVTELKYRLHPVGPSVHGGLIAWPFARAAEIMAAYRQITSTAPRELAVWLSLLPAPPAPFVPEAWHGRKLCAMAVCYSGDPADAAQALAPIRALGDPVVDVLAEQPYVQVQSYLDDTEPAGLHYYWRTEYAASLGDDVLRILPELFETCPIPLGELGILHLEGALNDRSADDGVVGNRDARYVLGVKGMWEPGEPRAEEFRQWVRAAGERIHPLGTGRTYVNFQTADESPHRIRAAYDHNYERLLEIKRRFDPDNMFGSGRAVRV